VSHQAGVWEYDPSSDHLAWSFPEGVALEDLAHDELDRLLSALRCAADLSGPGSVVEELHIGDPDGKKDQWIAIYGRRILGVEAKLKVVGVVLDVSDTKSQVQANQMVISELEHRMRNTAAVAQSLAMSILRSSDSLAKAQETLSDRFDAMNQSGTSLDEQRWRRATVTTVLRITLEGLGIEERCELCGPPAEVTASVARALSMVVHELATNAMKHGALANERGSVRISWRTGTRPWSNGGSSAASSAAPRRARAMDRR
jgi:two-component sensor histidine kinase